REQRGERDSDEIGIGVVKLAVGKRQLGRLDQGVKVVGRVVAHRAQVEAFEQRELLEKDRPLRPRPTFEHRRAAIAAADRLLDTGREGGEVFERKKTAVGLAVADNLARDVAAIEALERRAQAGRTSTVAMARLGVEQAAE